MLYSIYPNIPKMELEIILAQTWYPFSLFFPVPGQFRFIHPNDIVGVDGKKALYVIDCDLPNIL